MNLVESFAKWLSQEAELTLGQELFKSRAPSGINAQDGIYWLVGSGGDPETKNINSGYLQTQRIDLFSRDQDPQIVYDNLESLQNLILSAGCMELCDFEVISVSIAGPFVDQDLDNEERQVGLIQISITTYKE